MKILMMALTAFTLVATACSSKKGSEGVDSDGSCTQATVDSFNSINTNAKMFVKTNQTSYLKTAADECARFSSLIGGQSCNAREQSTGASIVITLADANRVCDAVNKALNPKKTNKTEETDADEDSTVDVEALYEIY